MLLKMIQTKKDLKTYIQQDSRNYQSVVGHRRWWHQMSATPISDQWYIWKYIRYMRYCEYHLNNSGLYHYLMAKYWLYRLRVVSRITGFQIPPNTVDSGLTIWHWGAIVINPVAHIGKNCTLNPGIIVGHKKVGENAPQIGDNVFIGGGAKIIGAIHIGNNVIIAPNAVVVKDVRDGCIVGGVPCKVIGYNK